MIKILIILLIIFPNIALSQVHTPKEWVKRYTSKCISKTTNRVCIDKTKRNFKRMIKHKKMLFTHLEKYNLPLWLATIPFIESEYAEKAISRAGAVGMWQVMPHNLQHYMTTRWNGINYHYTRRPKRNYAINQGKKPEINTDIACRMLSHLYSKYGKNNHETVVRAYNAGETRIDKALKGLGKPLTDETLNYYNQLMALQILLDDITSGNLYGLR